MQYTSPPLEITLQPSLLASVLGTAQNYLYICRLIPWLTLKPRTNVSSTMYEMLTNSRVGGNEQEAGWGSHGLAPGQSPLYFPVLKSHLKAHLCVLHLDGTVASMKGTLTL